MLGMYVHTHWGYNRPYAARAWTFEDWQGYLAGLHGLGYRSLLIWPLLDCMPPEPTESDAKFLAMLGRVIHEAHARYGLRVAVVMAPNTIGNEKSAGYAFAERPYFIGEKKVNPGDAAEVEWFLRGRRCQLEPLREADALAIIDSDPGGYIGSTHAEFVALVKGQMGVFRSFNPRAEFIYWMWFGWEAYNRWWAETLKPPAERQKVEWGGFTETLALLRRELDEPWSVFACSPAHCEATASPDLLAKRCYYPYGLMEGEPTFPLTNYAPRSIGDGLKPYTDAPQSFPRGVLANAQTHCLQLPHTYLFAHCAQGGAPENADWERFADDLLPGEGALVARGWRAIEQRDPARQLSLAEALRRRAGRAHKPGRLGGLLFGDADRFLTDLAMNLELRAALSDLKSALDASLAAAPGAVRRVLSRLRPYQQRLGFVDAYYGPLEQELNRELRRLNVGAIDAVLNAFEDWRDPALRHGILPRLLDAMETYGR